MPYTYKAVALVWLLILGLFALSGSGMVVGPWVVLLVGSALVIPPLILTLSPKPVNSVLAAIAFVPAAAPSAEAHELFRLRAIMRQGTAASLPAVWEQYTTIEAARAAVRGMYANDRVSRVLVVTGDVPPRFVEWVER